MTHIDRPDCKFCSHGKAENTGRKRIDGTICYRRYNGKFICGTCRLKKYPNLQAARKESSARRGYKVHRKMYCENIDGRLGFKCTAKIVHRAQLQVDHILENRARHKDCDHPDNLQTLCANCHTMKSYYVKNYQEDKLEYMVRHIYKRLKVSEYKKIAAKIIKSHKVRLKQIKEKKNVERR